LRRVITMAPSFVVVGLGVNATQALGVSLVVRSFAWPVPMAALVWFTCRKAVTGAYRNRALMIVAAAASALAVLALNAVLLLQTFGVEVPGLSA